MAHSSRKEAENSLFRGQKYKFEGYPEWYNEQLAKNEPIPVELFGGQLQEALFFYQKEISKLGFANNVLNTQMGSVLKEIDELSQMIAEAEDLDNSSGDDKKKRVRRCANQIERKFVCPVPNCEKSYGTEGSMAQHMRLKHPGVSYNMADLNPDTPPKIEIHPVNHCVPQG